MNENENMKSQTHRCEFDRFAAVHGCQKQVAVAIDEQQLAIGREAALIERNLGHLNRTRYVGIGANRARRINSPKSSEQ